MELTLATAQKIMNKNGGSLDLSGTQITTLPEGLTVGDSLYLSGTQITSTSASRVKRLQNGDYVDRRYVYADGILTHVRGRKMINGYTVYIGKIAGRHVVSDGTVYAHCSKISDGIQDIAFKHAADRGAETFERYFTDRQQEDV